VDLGSCLKFWLYLLLLSRGSLTLRFFLADLSFVYVDLGESRQYGHRLSAAALALDLILVGPIARLRFKIFFLLCLVDALVLSCGRCVLALCVLLGTIFWFLRRVVSCATSLLALAQIFVASRSF